MKLTAAYCKITIHASPRVPCSPCNEQKRQCETLRARRGGCISDSLGSYRSDPGTLYTRLHSALQVLQVLQVPTNKRGYAHARRFFLPFLLAPPSFLLTRYTRLNTIMHATDRQRQRSDPDNTWSVLSTIHTLPSSVHELTLSNPRLERSIRRCAAPRARRRIAVRTM